MRVCRLSPLKWLASRGRVVMALAASALLAGCASTLRMDNTVQSFSALSEVPAAASYRYERLPSQRQDPAQPQLEAMAERRASCLRRSRPAGPLNRNCQCA